MIRCALCNSDAKLQKSHIIPAFVFRWQKRTGGPIRATDNPNVRVQDGPKTHLFCEECEQTLSNSEKLFNEIIFRKIPDYSSMCCNYGPWLSRFCASITYRNLIFSIDEHVKAGRFSQAEVSIVNDCIDRLKKFLLGEKMNVGPFEQHIIIMEPIVDHNIPNPPKNLNRYLLRAINLDILKSPKSSLSFVKLGPVIIAGIVYGNFKKNMNSKVHMTSGTISREPAELMSLLIPYLVEKSRKIECAFGQISDTQLVKIETEFANRATKGANDQLVKAMLFDFDLS